MTVHTRPPVPELRQHNVGAGRICAKRHGSKTRVERLFQSGPAKLRLPETYGDGLEAVLINTAGGMTGGDRLDWQVTAKAGADLTITSQACERIYKSEILAAKTSVSLCAEAGSTLSWLPQETILFDRSRFNRTIEANIAPDATLIAVEAMIFGREAMGEDVIHAQLNDRWHIRMEDRMVHAEAVRLSGGVKDRLRSIAGLGGSIASATVLMFSPNAEGFIQPARKLIAGSPDGILASANHLPLAPFKSGKLVVRVVARDNYTLRKLLCPLIGLLRGKANMPKIWST